MKRKLIEMKQEYLITCDNVRCDYRVENTSKDPHAESAQYIDMPCPKCGENLLTIQDFLQAAKIVKAVDWLNKWFSWILIFTPKSKQVKDKTVSVHCYDGVKIKEEN